MSVNIHGREYVTVAERVQALHEDIKGRAVSITTEFLPSGNGAIVCRATVKIADSVFQGTSAANPSKAIEKQSPYEVAETSAIGRALGFAGYGIVEGIATADEIVKVNKNGTSGSVPVQKTVSNPITLATTKQKGAIFAISKNKGIDTEVIKSELGIPSLGAELTIEQASKVIDWLNEQ